MATRPTDGTMTSNGLRPNCSSHLSFDIDERHSPIPFDRVHDIFHCGQGNSVRETPRAQPLTDKDQQKDPATYTEFERRYPPDHFGQEASENARAWRLYRDKVNELDSDLIKGWDDTLSTLLVFAGLFSAVMTAFLVESSQKLQPDYAEYTNKAVLALLAHLNGSYIPPAVELEPRHFRPDGLSRTVNALWFVSLTLALAVSLSAILVKQWLVEFNTRMRRPAASARLWARRHATFRHGLDEWRLGALISSLPFLLHVALFLFLLGLQALLFQLDVAIFTVVLVMASILTVGYIAANLLPLWFGICPSFTPLLGQSRRVFEAARTYFCRLIHPTVFRLSHLWLKVRYRLGCTPWRNLDDRLYVAVRPAAYEQETLLSQRPAEMDAEILAWMILHLTADETEVALDAIGALDGIQHRRLYSSPLHMSSNPFNFEHIRRSVATQARERLASTSSDQQVDVQVARILRTAINVGADLSLLDVFQPMQSVRVFHPPKTDLDVLWCIVVPPLDRLDGHVPSTFKHLLPSLKMWAQQSGPVELLPSTLGQLLGISIRYNLQKEIRWEILYGVGLCVAAATDQYQQAGTVYGSLAADVAQMVLSWNQPHQQSPLSPPGTHGLVQILVTWSTVVSAPDQFGASEQQLKVISRSYTRALEMSNLILRTTLLVHPSLAILALSCVTTKLQPETGHALFDCWSSAAQSGALSILQSAARPFNPLSTEPSPWSSFYGTCLFNLTAWLLENPDQGGDRSGSGVYRLPSVVLAQLLDDASDLPFHHTFIKLLRLENGETALLEETRLNVLRRQEYSDGTDRSTWRMLIPAGINPTAMLPLAASLSVYLRLMRALGIDCADMFQELLDDEIGLRLIRVSSAYFGQQIAIHAKLAYPEWWEQARVTILADTDDWLVEDVTPAEFVQVIDSTHSCRDCELSLKLARRDLKKQGKSVISMNPETRLEPVAANDTARHEPHILADISRSMIKVLTGSNSVRDIEPDLERDA